MKKCRVCGIVKNETEFYFRSDTGKFRSDCKSCFILQSSEYHKEHLKETKQYKAEYYIENKDGRIKEYRINNREQILATKKNNREKNSEKIKVFRHGYHVKNRSRGLWQSVSRGDKQKGRECMSFEIWEKFMAFGACYYCGFAGPIGLDRIDNSIGHIVGNCLPCCHACNISKWHFFSLEEAKREIGPAIRRVRRSRNESLLSDDELVKLQLTDFSIIK